MNAAVTSKEEILKTSRELIRQQGWSTVSIRAVAAACQGGADERNDRQRLAGDLPPSG